MIHSETIQVKKLNNYAKIPAAGSDFAAGYDVYAAIDKPVTIRAFETIKIGTGIAVAIPENYWLALFARSGLATKRGLRPANCVGVIDPDYRGEIIMPVYNDSGRAQTIDPGERIGQLILMPRYGMHFKKVDELDSTERNAGGFGSTGTK